jgi:hypothetical protein
VEVTGGPRENHRPVASHRQTVTYNEFESIIITGIALLVSKSINILNCTWVNVITGHKTFLNIFLFNKYERISKRQSKMNNPEKLAT